uniref:Uncharacterized protein n=1 Tax=Hyaloperonospora arabidopsidis (strain Emoy2) TaxID=559515 RepID=M4BUD4_HYAAE
MSEECWVQRRTHSLLLTHLQCFTAMRTNISHMSGIAELCIVRKRESMVICYIKTRARRVSAPPPGASSVAYPI